MTRDGSWLPDIKIFPSVLNADMLDLGRDLKIIERGGGDGVHIDVMDGHFVPNLSMGPHIVESIRPATGMEIDVHLMVTNPEMFIGPFLDAGADSVTVHAEIGPRIARLLDLIRKRGKKAAVSLKPRTPLAVLGRLLEHADMVLLMTVEPGYGGQPFQPRLVGKIRALRRKARRVGIPLDIQVDGGITPATAKTAVKAGANVLVAGSSVFGARDPVAALKYLRRVALAAGVGGTNAREFHGGK
jgi:ribulose-phosphate 3-epimerase